MTAQTKSSSQCSRSQNVLTWTVRSRESSRLAHLPVCSLSKTNLTLSASKCILQHHSVMSKQSSTFVSSVHAFSPTSACFLARTNNPSEACCSCCARCDCACGVVSLPVDAPPLSVYRPPLGTSGTEGCGDMRCAAFVARSAGACASGLWSIVTSSPRCGEGSGDGRHCSG